MAEKKIDFAKEVARLDEIVEEVSSKALSLDESLKLYEEGTAIIAKLEKALKEAQEKVDKIVTIEDKQRKIVNYQQFISIVYEPQRRTKKSQY